jgi:signal transduction histidine kinase
MTKIQHASLWTRLLTKWWVVPLIGLFVLYLDLYLDFNRDKQSTLSIVNTGFIIALFLISFGFLLGIYWQRNASEKSALRTLTRQHNFSVQLSNAKDWDEILTVVSDFIATFLNIFVSYLYVYQYTTGSYLRLAYWVSDRIPQEQHQEFEQTSLCENCRTRQDFSGQPHLCTIQEQGHKSANLNDYCLHLHVESEQIGILNFSLANDDSPAPWQIEILKTMMPYLAVVIQSAVQRQTLLDLSVITAAENERRTLTHDLHDTLGQNLSFLRLKLDQMARNNRYQRTDKIQKDLDHMLVVAAESTELVQETLIILDPDESPPLSKVIKEYCEIIGARSNLDVQFKLEGKPVYMSQQVSRQIFYLLREALSNVEKHAHASKVSVLMIWSETDLEIRIADNGSGFNLEEAPADGHFGLKSMRQRVDNLEGEFKITSAPGQGTHLDIRLPHRLQSPEFRT